MKLVGRIPVEPLDEERLVNIERSIVANAKLGPHEAPSSRRHLAFAGAAFAVVAAAVVGWKLRGAPVAVAPEAPERFAIATDAQRSVLALDDAGATITSDPGSAFEVRREHGKVIVQMTRGKLDLAVQHREDRLLVVRAGTTDVEDVGTKFSVAWDGSGDVDVRVREGAVKVKHAHGEVLVAQGQEWRPSGVIALVEAPEVPAVVATAASSGNGSGSGSGSAAIVVATNEPVVLHERHAAAPPAPAPQPRPAHVEDERPVLGEPISSERRAAAAAAAAPPSDPYVDLKVAIRKRPLADDPKIDGAGDATAEIARLKKIAYSPTISNEASKALYTIALLLHKPLHQDSEALRTLDVYRRRFRSGKESAAVAWLRLRITCGHAIDDECRQAAYSYQHQAPSGDGAEVAVRITNAQ